MLKWAPLFLYCTWLTACSGVGSQNGPQCVLAFTSETAGKELGVNNADPKLGGDELAQSFLISDNKTISNVFLKLQRIGFSATSPKGYKMVLRIETNAAAIPSGTLVNSTSNEEASINLEDMNADSRSYTFSFSSGISLTKNTLYWMRLRATYPASKQDYVKWSAFQGNNGYSDGKAIYETGVSNNWSTQNIGDLMDFVFELGCS